MFVQVLLLQKWQFVIIFYHQIMMERPSFDMQQFNRIEIYSDSLETRTIIRIGKFDGKKRILVGLFVFYFVSVTRPLECPNLTFFERHLHRRSRCSKSISWKNPRFYSIGAVLLFK